MKINTHILGLLVVVGLFSLQSCDDESYDIEGSNQNYVYINVNRWTSTEYPQNTFVYEVLRTPIGSSLESGPEIVKVGVRSTKVVNPEKPDVPLNKNDAFQKVQKRHVQEKR
ncbi:hypothetical protein NXX31_13915 [Bacteroides thetaiotaomicron]|uniref:hypothetical protein n=1 Tax=Bacteroides thetaiotaomicron TaxID=818 RepID=UPI002166BDAD|nr:hypothetical protein [Bacteroides thetaiotaomicron]MCS3329819.1 hypothetical protein [Bacteroides thetaiotaomicron]